MPPLEPNLHYLEARYLDNEETTAFLEWYEATSSDRRQRDWILRSHLVRGIPSAEVLPRDGLDNVLHFIAICELASWVGEFPADLPSKFKRFYRDLLFDESVMRYYVSYYPTILPLLFAWRLDGQSAIPYGAFEHSSDTFNTLLGMSSELDSPPVSAFLSLVDDYKIDIEENGKTSQFTLNSVLSLLQDVKTFAAVKLDSAEKDGIKALSLAGLTRFLRFSVEMDRFLDHDVKDPLLQSAYWNLHGYWFHLLSGKTYGVLNVAFERYREWAKAGSGVSSDLNDSLNNILQGQVALKRLCSSLYRFPLDLVLLGRRATATQDNPREELSLLYRHLAREIERPVEEYRAPKTSRRKPAVEEESEEGAFAERQRERVVVEKAWPTEVLVAPAGSSRTRPVVTYKRGGARKRKPTAAFMKAMTPDGPLAAVVGSSAMPRTEVTRKIWAYIKRKGLQDKKNRRMIIADNKLKTIFGGKSKVPIVELDKLVKKHLK